MPIPPRLDSYLQSLHTALAPLPPDQADDIVKEMRSHILESLETGNDLDAVFDRLGRPHDLAAQYLAENLVQRARRTRSPWLVLHTVARWATLSIGGVFALAGLLIGYALAACLAICVLTKPIHPDTVGLWRFTDGNDVSFSLHLGLGAGAGTPPPNATELLGWWIIPLGLTLGVALCWITSRVGLWSLHLFRPRRALRVRPT